MAQFKTLHYYKGNLTKKLPCIMPRGSSPVDTSSVDYGHRLEVLKFTLFMLLAGTMAVLDVASVLLIIFLVHRGI